jgi:ABC-2 type transport system permease protein
LSALAKDRVVPVPLALATRNLLRNARSPMLLAASLLQPVVWLLLFSQIFSGLGDTVQFRRLGYGSYLELFVPGMLVLSMLFTALQSGLATVTDIDTGVMDKLLISPIRRSSILLGRIAADGVTMAVQAVIILGLAVLMGASWRTGWPGALALLGCAVAFGVVWSSVSNLIALRTRNAELTMVAGLFLTLPVLFLSSAFFPKPLLPGWLQTVADLNPAAYVIQAGQQLMSIGNDWGMDLRMLAAIAGAAIVLLPASVAAFRAATRRQG